MKITNITRKTVLSENAEKATSIPSRAFGLLRYKHPHTLLIKTRFGIHTIGMRFPIDILVLDNSKKVVALKHNLKPYNFFLWNPRHSTVLELPTGIISKTNTKKGDKITLD